MPFPVGVKKLATVAALLIVSVTATQTTDPVSAGPNGAICTNTTARGAIDNNFPLDACFDGSTLFIDNRTNVPMYVSFTGTAGSSSRSELDAGASLASRAFMETHSQEAGLLMPGYRIQVPVGPTDFTATLEGTNHTRSYPLVRWLTEWVPGISSVDTVIGAANEFIQVFDEHSACLSRNGWLGDIGCEALYLRNVGFALGRLTVNATSDVLGAVLTLLGTAKWADETAGEVQRFLNGPKTITLAPIPVAPPVVVPPVVPPVVVPPVAPPVVVPPVVPPVVVPPVVPSVVVPPPVAPPVVLSPLVFSVTGSCTTSGGALGASSANFTPGSRYTIGAWYPDGSPYTALSLGSTGTVRSDSTISWQWDCTGDPAGTYTTELVDAASGRSTGRVAFTIGAPPPPDTQPQATQPAAQVWTEKLYFATSPTFDAGPGRTSNSARRTDQIIGAGTLVQVDCRSYDLAIATSNTGGWWYHLVSPFPGQWTPASLFWNNADGTGLVDEAVRIC